MVLPAGHGTTTEIIVPRKYFVPLEWISSCAFLLS
jgi:hypothetical protein